MAYTLRQALDFLTPSPCCERIIDIKPDKGNQQRLTYPIHVWSFWTGKRSPTVDLCLKSWKKHLPSDKYKIHVLDEKSVNEWIKTDHVCFTSGGPALRSDYIRIELLHKHGGVWMDSSVILLQSLESWEVLNKADDFYCFSAFFNSNNMSKGCMFPVIETSFMISPPKHKLVSAWRERLHKITGDCKSKDFDTYFENNDSSALQRKYLQKHYHLVYHMLQHALKYAGGLDNFKGVHLYKASDKKLCYLSTPINRPLKYPPPLIKLVASERKRADSLLEKNLLPKESVLFTASAPEKRK